MLSKISRSNFYDLDLDTSKCICLPENVTLTYADAAIKESGICFCCLRDEYGKIKAVLYDSDINRIRELGTYETATALEAARNNCMLQPSILFDINVDYLFYEFPCAQFPVVNDERNLVAIVRNTRPLTYSVKENIVVLMAGGLGMRLRPYTENTPKPLLSFGGLSILERILIHFRYYGFRNFYISVYYLAEQIEKNIGDGSQFGLNIRYIHEEKPLGTAGAISMMEQPELPCLVSNSDLLMDVDLDRLLSSHKEFRALGTMCTYNYAHKIDYGVVQSEDEKYCGIAEKPTHYFPVNTGLYCLDPQAWNYFSKDKKLDMPTLFDKMSRDHRKVCVYPHLGKWIDVGTLNVFKRLSGEA